MKSPAFIKKFLSIIFLLTGILLCNVTYAVQPRLILFCSAWNMKCRVAQKACSAAAKELDMYFLNLDIDMASSQQTANELGINIPPSIPYIYVLNEKGKPVMHWLYNGESTQSIKQKITGN